jgi:alkylhydroperoxidase family enzyme
MARIPPIPPKEWPPEMRESLAAMIPPVRRHPEPIRENRPKGRNTLGTFAQHPELARAFFTFNGHVLWANTLSTRQREILVLRIAARRRCTQLWAEHVFAGRDAGLTDEEIARIAFGPEAPFFEPLERALVRAADELIDEGVVSDETWATLASELDTKQLLDVVFTAGAYETVAWFFRSADVEIGAEVHDLLRGTPGGEP